MHRFFAIAREQVLSAASNQADIARLIAATAPHSGDFHHELPFSAVGTRLDDTSPRIAIAVRQGVPVCAQHTCVCGAVVHSSGTHGPSCRKLAGRHMRHSALNYHIKRSFAAAEMRPRLEPSSLSRFDGKRPDEMTIVPWKQGRSLVWDVTCPDT
jgi:hypothetical protein